MDEPLTWWQSVRIAGWFGGKAEQLTLDEAADALRNGLRGRSRRRATEQRVGELAGEAAARYDTGQTSPASAFEVLSAVLEPEPAIDGTALPRDALLRVAEDVGTTAQLGSVLAMYPDERLAAIHREESAAPVLATVDLESDPATGTISEVAVARRSPARAIRTLSWVGCPEKPVSTALADTVLIAHNGYGHDYPLLDAAGVALPDSRSDSLRWSWLAFPTEDSHGQLHLATEFGLAANGSAHTAEGDAEILAELCPIIADAISDIAPERRAAIRVALEDREHEEVLDLLLGKTPADEPEIAAIATASPRPAEQASRPAPRFVEKVETGALSDGSIVVAPSLRRARQVCDIDEFRVLVDGRRSIDEDLLLEDFGSRGWADALAVRLLDSVHGALDAAPPSAISEIELLPVREAGGVVLGADGPVLCDTATAVLHGRGCQLVVADPLEVIFSWPSPLLPLPTAFSPPSPDVDGFHLPLSYVTEPVIRSVAEALDFDEDVIRRGRLVRRADRWWWGPASLDPIECTGALSLVGLQLHFPEAALSRLWEVTLGGQPSGGPMDTRTPAVEVTHVEGVLGGSQASLPALRALARLLVSRVEMGDRVVLQTSWQRAESLAGGLSGWWRASLGHSLLHPPVWPTAQDARGRLSNGSASAAVTGDFATTQRVVPAADVLIVDRIATPDPSLPVVQRLAEELGDPYSGLIEPLSALQLLRLAEVHDQIIVTDPVIDSPLLRHVLDLGSIHRTTLDELASSALSHDAAASLGADTGHVPASVLERAAERVLPPGADLREFQSVLLGDLTAGSDVFGVFRTGSGKSAIYQTYGLGLSDALGKTTIVVTPLISLQRNQVRALHKRGIWEATMLNSELPESVRAGRLRGIRAGFYRMVYISAEGLHSQGVRSALQAGELGLVVLDEAHVVTEQGHDFRPDQRLLRPAISRMLGLDPERPIRDIPGRPQFLAMTGTATPAVRRDVASVLDIPFVVRVDGTFVRTELEFGVVDIELQEPRAGWPEDVERPRGDVDRKWPALLDELRAAGRPAICYAATRTDTETLADALAQVTGERVAAYHAGVDDRAGIEARFLDGELDIIVATNAFGMGIDKDDVVAVIHWAVPSSPEALYQEAGRAGRGLAGQPARCTLLYHADDLDFATWLAAQGQPDREDLERTLRTLEELREHATDPSRILVSDEDVTRLAGLRSRVDPQVAIGYLQRSGLVAELSRLSDIVCVRLNNGGGGASDPIEAAVLEACAEAGPGDIVDLSLTEILESFGSEARHVGPSTVRAAIRSLERRRLLTVDRFVSLKRLGLSGSAWRERRDELSRVLHALADDRPGRWVSARVPNGVSLAGFSSCLELLAGLGIVELDRRPVRSQPARVRRRSLSPDLHRCIKAAERILGQVPDTGSAWYGIAELTAMVGTGSREVTEQALLAAHHLGALSIDPASWQGSVARVLRLAPTTPEERDERLDRAIAAARRRRRDDRLRAKALHRYANLEPADEADIYQHYLERYFTDPTFLEDLAAGEAGRALEGLNPEQREAVTADDDLVAIVAGPGTGKTRTLTRRIAFRVARGLADPQRIVAVTFTGLAAAELRSRLGALGIPGVRAQTMHSLAYEVLRLNYHAAGFSHPPRWLAGGELKRAQQRALRTFATAGLTPRQIHEVLERIAAAGWSVVAAPQQRWGQVATNRPWDPRFGRALTAWRRFLLDNDAVDPAFAILLASRVLEGPEGAHYRAACEELFVDEYQDVNPSEHELLHALRSGGRMTVVGDPRQAIYGWRGADSRLLEGFWRSNEAVCVALTRNYRSGTRLIDKANEWSETFSDAPPLMPTVPWTGSWSVRRSADDGIVASIREHLAAGTPDEEIAVLARGRKTMGRLQQRLAQEGIAVAEARLQPIWQTEAFRALEQAIRSDVPPEDSTVSEWLQGFAVRDLVDPILQGVDEQARDANEADWSRILEHVRDAEVEAALSQSQVIAAVRARDEELRRRLGAGDVGIRLLSVHGAKGREFDVILIADADKQSWFSSDPDEIKRLWYVAITRARRVVERHLEPGTTAYG